MVRRLLGLSIAASLVLPAATAGARVSSVPAAGSIADDAAQGSSDVRLVDNIAYPNGTGLDLGQFTVRKLDSNGDPICVRDPDTGECVVDGSGNVVYETEQRDYAFAGSENNGIRVVDVTDPEQASVAALIDCRATGGDLDVRPDLGLLVVGTRSASPQCGPANGGGILVFDVSDPRKPGLLSARPMGLGATSVAFHPVAPLVYAAGDMLVGQAGGYIDILDLSNPAAPVVAGSFVYRDATPVGVSFNTTGTRAFVAATEQSDILDVSNPKSPTLVSTIHDPTIALHRHAVPTPDGTSLVIADQLVTDGANGVCPGGGLHIYDITNETQPQASGVFLAHDQQTRSGWCNAAGFGISPDGKLLAAGWMSGGTRLVDLTEKAGLGTVEIGYLIPSGLGGNAGVANTRASKPYKGYIYSNDGARGLDIMQYKPAVVAPTTAKGVVSLIDTGINPYHKVFKWNSPLAYQHPSTFPATLPTRSRSRSRSPSPIGTRP